MTAPTENGVPISTLSPKYLHSNSTSHAGPFSAIAELIDNAYDPDVCAKQIWIDVPLLRGQKVLSFMDNGNGLDRKTMHKMLSFGYSDKSPVKDRKPIGMYGNGFKSGAMRLGRDAIVFSKSKSTSCVGMLSQTYLEETQAEHIAVPIVCFEGSEPNLCIREDQRVSLEAILKYSPFKTEEELLTEIRAITSPGTNTKTGTRIIIWNLRRTSTGSTELDFQTDRYDIQFPSDFPESTDDSIQQPDIVASHIPKSSYSLRAYCSLLYLKPRMQILLRGFKVTSRLIAKSLALTHKDLYKPAFLENKKISITFGYNTESKHQYGIMMYHKNRLIKAYERVGCQLKTNYHGVGVIGIIECGEFLEPTHNKQSFNETDKYRRTMTSLGTKLDDYCKEMSHRRRGKYPSDTTPVEDTIKLPDQTWVQCDDCLKWRKVPDGFQTEASAKWTCSMNPDPQFRDCNVEGEHEDSEDEQSGYKKTYKQTQKLNQKKQREQKQKEQVRLVVVAKEKEDPKLQLEEMTPSKASPSQTNTGRNRSESPQEGAATASPYQLRSSIPQVDCSSPRSSWESVDVSPPPRAKRTLPQKPTATKRLRVQNPSQHPSEALNMRDKDQSIDVDVHAPCTETHHQDTEEAAGPSWAGVCDEDHTQVHMPESMQSNRVSDEVEKFTQQLQHMQSRLQQLVETEGGCNHSQFERAIQKFNELIVLLKTVPTQHNTAPGEERDMADKELQVGGLLQGHDLFKKERD